MASDHHFGSFMHFFLKRIKITYITEEEFEDTKGAMRIRIS